jgi:signal transduction histidine kinase
MDGAPQADRVDDARGRGVPAGVRRGGVRGDRPAGGFHPNWGDDFEPPWANSRWGRPERHRRRVHGRVVFAVLIFLIEALGVHWASENQAPVRLMDHLGYGLIALGCFAMIWRIRWRIPALIVTIAATVAYVLLGYPYGPFFLSSLISIVGALRARHRTGTWITLAAGYTVYVTLGHIVPSTAGHPIITPSVTTAILVAAWIIVACAVGEGIRNRTERMAEISRTYAEQQRTRTEQKRRQESEERLRIAAELHDVLGHHLSLINVQAGVGLHLMNDDPAQARTSLETIKQASAEALGEVRAVLSMLRDKDERAPRAPAPGLADLRALIDEEHTVIEGAPQPLPPDVDRAAFRITQESLTNVRRHAGEHATATVVVAYEPDRLRLVITDDGVGPDPAYGSADGPDRDGVAAGRPAGDDAQAGSIAAALGAAAARPVTPRPTAARPAGTRPPADDDASAPTGEPGSGIVGMRTRAEALGGTLTTGPAPGGGFRVVAELPLPHANR